MFPTGFNPSMYTGGWPTTMPVPGYVPGAPTPGWGYAGAPQGATAGGFGALIGNVATATAPERFVSSQAGGVVIGADGAPAGRVPENSFVDLKDGSVYGPDGKRLELPEGASVDFFDLPDIATMTGAFNGPTSATGSGGTLVKDAPAKGPSTGTQTAVDGQWGPGGVTSFKGGAAPAKAGGCDHHGNGGTQVGGVAGSGTTPGSGAPAAKGDTPTTKAGGPAAPHAALANLQAQLAQGMAQLVQLTGIPPAVGGASGGGPMHALGGARHLGHHPGDLQHSLNELIVTLRDLVTAMQQSQGGGPAQDGPAAKGGADETSTTPASTDTSTDDSTSVAGAKDEKATDDDTSTTDDSSESLSTSDTSTS